MKTGLPFPVIVLPGVPGTYLRDLYPIPPDTVWSVLTKNYGRVKLHPDNKRYEATQPAMVTADQIHRVAYEELVEELRYHLSKSEDEPVPVFPFGYDWRHPLGLIEE